MKILTVQAILLKHQLCWEIAVLEHESESRRRKHAERLRKLYKVKRHNDKRIIRRDMADI